MKRFSVIIPIYNRPEELDELLESLEKQTFKDFEVLVVEDGSTHKCDEVVKHYSSLLDIKYFFKNICYFNIFYVILCYTRVHILIKEEGYKKSL